jgi:hypothetical protein
MERRDTRPKLFILRLLPVGMGCICVGALCWLIAIDASESGVSVDTFRIYVAFGLPLSLIATIVMIVPTSLLWVVCFESLKARFPREQTVATISSGITASVGISAFILLFRHISGGGWLWVGEMAQASLLPLFLAMFWTWRMFSSEGAAQ